MTLFSLVNCRILRRAVAVALALTGAAADCRAAPPPNPVLEERQTKLQQVEAAWRAKPSPSASDWLALGIARFQVWQIHHGRGYHSIGTHLSERWEAAANRRQAARLLPKVTQAFQQAMAGAADARTAAAAKWWLACLYATIPDRDQQIAMLQRILRDHPTLDDPTLFDGTPQFYCNRTLAVAYRETGNRALAVDAYAQAALAIADRAATETNRQPLVTQTVGDLLAYEPRIALPRYQALLPAGMESLLRRHQETAPNQITLTVEQANVGGVVVGYTVVFPEQPRILREWKERAEKVHLADNFPPAYVLQFVTVPATDGFASDPEPPRLEVTATGYRQAFSLPLKFDPHGTATGEVTLAWVKDASARKDLYLSASLLPGRTAGPREFGEVHCLPVRITVPPK